MYRVRLDQSLFPPQDDDRVLPTTLSSILIEAAADARAEEALVEAGPDGTTGRRWTFASLAAETERLADALARRFSPDERIAIWAPNIPEWVLTEFAAAHAGLTLVTVNPAYQAKELAFVLSQSRAAGLLLVRDFRGNPMGEIARKVVAELPAIRHVIDLEDHEALFATEGEARALGAAMPEDPVQVQYTSGTTGFPKGAVLSHRGLTNNARLTLSRLGVKQGDCYLNPMPMFHTAGCSLAVLGALQKRARLVLARQFDAAGMNLLIEKERVDAIMGVPTMLIGMCEAQAHRPRDVSSLRVAMSGGAMVPPELVRRFTEQFGARLSIIYGQTETSPVVTQTRLDDSFADQTGTIGQPLPATGLSIRSLVDNKVLPVGSVGEICTSGYCNMIAYNDDPAATAKTIDAEGWLHTGDLGIMDARGFLKVTGRVKDMIIRGGENLFPAEIENVLLEHPAVAEAAVVGVPDDKWGEIAICFVRCAEGTRPSRAELIAHCRRDLAAPKTPAEWIEVSGFPMTASGKIQKFVLREKFLAGEYRERL
ncbi:MAG: AMP-binding protein [Alphaproteobacteria bacterium]|nr:AMP-binding protein [Alphaproteobacteria bacterium]